MAKSRNKRRQKLQDEEQNENPSNPNGIIILGVYIHCEGCENEVLKCLRGFDGVEGIAIDAKNHKVTVMGERADPIKVAERLRKKTGKNVQLISPKPKKEEKKEEIKPECGQPEVVEVVLKVYIHCEGCAKDVKHCIHDMEGVQTVDLDMEKNLVTVKGTMDPYKLMEFIIKRTGRHAEIPKLSSYEDSNGEDDETEENIYYHNLYPPTLVYAPQLFNDENPNSCSVM